MESVITLKKTGLLLQIYLEFLNVFDSLWNVDAMHVLLQAIHFQQLFTVSFKLKF